MGTLEGGKVYATAWLRSLQNEEKLKKETFYNRKWRAENELDRSGYEGYTYHINHPEKMFRVADKITEVTPRDPVKLRPQNLKDTDVENAVQRKFGLDRVRRRILSQTHTTK